ncbi:MAG: CoA transferase [Actinobacteria bacterium]|nr:CoA transferase [Actinomycetota bacterium]
MLTGLLEGYVVLDLADLRGQFAGKLLADLGAEVIKIEPPEGDPVRRMGPFRNDEEGPDESLRFGFLNAGKSSVVLDLDAPDGREAFLRLVESADVVLESFDPGTLERRGLGRDVLSQRNPGLVVTSVTSFGQEGPYREYLAPHLVAFAMSGLMYVAGNPVEAPTCAPETQGFYYACVHAAYGTLLALWEREQRGHGELVDVSVQETLATQEHLLRIFGSTGRNVERHGSQHPFAAPANVFPASDGFVFLFASRVHWPKLLEVWDGHPEKYDDPQWEPDSVRRQHVEAVNADVAAFTSRFAKEELAHLMQSKGVPCLPVNAPSEFARDKQVEARGMVQQVANGGAGGEGQVGFPVLVDEQRVAARPAPRLGEHTAELLRRSQIESLVTDGGR